MDNTIRVLVVDDFPEFREWICSKLKTNRRFFIAGEAANGREAIQKVRVSGCDDEDLVRCALSNGAGGYLLKTNANQELVSAMEAVVLGERFVSSGLKVTRNAPQPLVYELAVT